MSHKRPRGRLDRDAGGGPRRRWGCLSLVRRGHFLSRADGFRLTPRPEPGVAVLRPAHARGGGGDRPCSRRRARPVTSRRVWRPWAALRRQRSAPARAPSPGAAALSPCSDTRAAAGPSPPQPPRPTAEAAPGSPFRRPSPPSPPGVGSGACKMAERGSMLSLAAAPTLGPLRLRVELGRGRLPGPPHAA